MKQNITYKIYMLVLNCIVITNIHTMHETKRGITRTFLTEYKPISSYLTNKLVKAYQVTYGTPFYQKSLLATDAGYGKMQTGKIILQKFNSILDYYQSQMEDYHASFAKRKYIPWKSKLSSTQLKEHMPTMIQYEQAYIQYYNDPVNRQHHEELLRHTQHMHKIMQKTDIDQTTWKPLKY